jgi:hypothetical protein
LLKKPKMRDVCNAFVGMGDGYGPGDGRGERIRTSGLYVPNVALYQAKLHPDMLSDAVFES